ncbi:hypothetical protein I6A62_42865 [Frankia sp. AgW1.1]|nr:hypothetical protein [Frankia sp. AgW1.1]
MDEDRVPRLAAAGVRAARRDDDGGTARPVAHGRGNAYTPSALERLRGKGGPVLRALTRRFGFGPAAVPETAIDRLEEMIAATPVPPLGASFRPFSTMIG